MSCPPRCAERQLQCLVTLPASGRASSSISHVPLVECPSYMLDKTRVAHDGAGPPPGRQVSGSTQQCRTTCLEGKSRVAHDSVGPLPGRQVSGSTQQSRTTRLEGKSQVAHYSVGSLPGRQVLGSTQQCRTTHLEG